MSQFNEYPDQIIFLISTNVLFSLLYILEIMFYITRKKRIFIKSNKLLNLLIIIYRCGIKFPYPSVST